MTPIRRLSTDPILMRMWADGIHADAIAIELGYLHRNAVYYRARTLGLPKRDFTAVTLRHAIVAYRSAGHTNGQVADHFGISEGYASRIWGERPRQNPRSKQTPP